MSFARVRLIVAALAFAGWLSYLGYAVTLRGAVPILSRGQLAACTHLVIADVSTDSQNLPKPAATVTTVIRGAELKPGDGIEVANLPEAQPPIGGFPGAGTYLIPLIRDGTTFRIAGLPTSPGYDARMPARPVIYPWNAEIRQQLEHLGFPVPSP